MTALIFCSQGHSNPSSHRFCQQCGEQLEQALCSGRVICDRYRIVEELGRGGFGHTYLVEDSNRFNERCVIKVFAPEVESSKALNKAKELFNREAGVLYRLEHPQIPKFREWFMEEPSLYLVQDYVEGQTYQTLLRQRKQQGQTFSESEVAQILRQTLPILEYIHGRGMIHRDISPDNLMERRCDRKPILIDFGGVKEITASFGHFGSDLPNGGVTLIGKPGYAPEEQIRLGRVSAASDIYALGVTALVLLVGQEPKNFFDPNSCTFRWQKYIQLSPEFAAILEKMVACHAVKRYRSASQVLQDLQHLDTAHSEAPSIVDTPVEAPVYSAQPQASFAASAVVTQPPVTQQTVVVAPPPPSPEPIEKAKARGGCGKAFLRLFQILLIVGAMIAAGAFAFSAVYNWLQQAPGFSAPAETPQPEPSSDNEADRKRLLFQRLRELEVGFTFFNQVTNEAFYLKYPNYPRRPLTKSAADADLRAQWDQVGLQVVDALEEVSATSRRRIGRYGPSTRQDWDRQLRQERIDTRRFYRNIDRDFQRQLPMYRGTELDGRRGQQIWFAIAADRLQQALN